MSSSEQIKPTFKINVKSCLWFEGSQAHSSGMARDISAWAAETSSLLGSGPCLYPLRPLICCLLREGCHPPKNVSMGSRFWLGTASAARPCLPCQWGRGGGMPAPSFCSLPGGKHSRRLCVGREVFPTAIAVGDVYL